MPTWHICQRSSNSLDGKAIMPTKGHSKLTLISNMSGIQWPSRGHTKLDRLSKLNQAILLRATRSHDAPHQTWLIYGNFSMKMHLDEVNPRALLSTLTSTSPPWGFRSPALLVSTMAPMVSLPSLLIATARPICVTNTNIGRICAEFAIML
jgi:hypothetical protein